ncbi:hypothetical protein DFP72DRAFT_1077813 [Ephemerocybe angulata]|uniref:Uncharacterized protein n=1 Tax=Ephemerocybe angulata TaxID=980116 RepID=A0A8H6LX03_9AGAR|nr:hypothetical protein DFP72DRAFT_1077813 [Tulosesus angulatus]
MSMNTGDAEKGTTPFLQRIQLKGPKGVIVRATGQVDDGAMRNCISKERWDGYGHCLEPLATSRTWIRVANNQVVPSMGRWEGTVTVGNTGAKESFEVFDCKGETKEELTNEPAQTAPAVLSITEEDPNWEQHLEPTPPENKSIAATYQTPPTKKKVKWLPQTQYEEERHERERWKAQEPARSEQRQRRLQEARAAAKKNDEEGQLNAEHRNKQRATNTPEDDELEAEWTRINLITISDDPWAETRWAGFLGLSDARDTDAEWCNGIQHDQTHRASPYTRNK